jgi:hypothetical protein
MTATVHSIVEARIRARVREKRAWEELCREMRSLPGMAPTFAHGKSSGDAGALIPQGNRGGSLRAVTHEATHSPEVNP